MLRRMRETGRRLARGVAPTITTSLESLPTLQTEVAALRDEVAALQRKIEELDEDVQESRRLNRRLAELTDVVQELLLPVAQRDDAKVEQLVRDYTTGL